MTLFHQLIAKGKKLIERFRRKINKSKLNKSKLKAIAFVDYEHWYYSYKKLFHLKPDVLEWRKQIEEEYRLEDLMIFGNFKYEAIREELNKIRSATNSIIETQQFSGDHEKDMTDFIMLDYIYQSVDMYPNIDTYIIFTGDAHFQSVIKYLLQKHDKKVVVYGVKGAFSSMLKRIATETIEFPATDIVIKGIYPLIVKNMEYVSGKSTIIPTFLATARTISEKDGVDEELVKIALNDMLDKGLLYKRQQRVDFKRFVPVLAANWEALANEGLWSF